MIKWFFLSLLVFQLLTVHARDNIQVFGNLPYIDNIKISPDGKKLAYLQNIEGKYHIVIKSIAGAGKAQSAFALEKAAIRSFEWGNDERIILHATIPYYSRGNYEEFTMHRLGILNIETNKAFWPFNKGLSNTHIIGIPTIINRLENKPDVVLASYGGKVILLNLKNGDREIYFNEWQSARMESDRLGQPIMYRRYDINWDEFYWNYKLPSEKEYRKLKIMKDNKEEDFTEVVLGLYLDDNTRFYYSQDDEQQISQLMSARVNGNKVEDIQQISTSRIHDYNDVLLDFYNSHIIGYSTIKDFTEYHYFDKKLASVYTDMIATFSGSEIEIVSYSRDKNRFIIKTSSYLNPLEYFYYDQSSGEFAKISSAYPTLDKSILGKVVKYQYKTDDETPITSYLTVPTKVNEKVKPALIVMPHGGPQIRDSMSFNWMRQFFVAEGFAVFQPNFRGSAGYGKKFSEAGYGEWGKKMQSDIDQGVQKLIDDGLVDGQKICVVGSSYGGYVALFSATARQHMYRCSISLAGISDLDDVLFHSEQQGGYSENLIKSIGDRKDQVALKKYSPLFLISDTTRPILMLHGDKDTVVPMFQSENMFKALKKAKVSTFKFIELEGEDHWLTLQTSRKVFLKESIQFINENIQ